MLRTTKRSIEKAFGANEQELFERIATDTPHILGKLKNEACKTAARDSYFLTTMNLFLLCNFIATFNLFYTVLK